MSGNTSEIRCVYMGCDREEKHWSHTVYEDKPIHIDNHPFQAPPEGEAVPEQVCEHNSVKNYVCVDCGIEFVPCRACSGANGTDFWAVVRHAPPVCESKPAPVVSTAAPERVELTIDEKLVILMEECAEVIQAASKCLRFGFKREQEGYGQNDKVLSGEIGDLLGMVDSLPLDQALIGFCRKRKLCKAEKAKAEYGK